MKNSISNINCLLHTVNALRFCNYVLSDCTSSLDNLEFRHKMSSLLDSACNSLIHVCEEIQTDCVKE